MTTIKMPLIESDQTIAVAYLVRGVGEDWFLSCNRFLDSYIRHDSGVNHSLYVIFKGFSNCDDLEKAKKLFNRVQYKPIFLEDNSFDIGAYIEWANIIEEDSLCVLNTASQILAHFWLAKLAVNLMRHEVGLVGATASYESLNELNSAFPIFPNIHIRSTAFMINRRLFCSITNGLKISSKVDAFHFESGPQSLTQQVLAKNKKILLVGCNGRGYPPTQWALSDTFRQGRQLNLLVADNQTRNFISLPWAEKKEFIFRTWGEYLGRCAGSF
jgi:hypothetical protein